MSLVYSGISENMTKCIIIFLASSFCGLCLAESPLGSKKIGVHYETKPSGRAYGSDGTVVDQYPTGKVYDMQGKPYASVAPLSIGRPETFAKPLPRATVNQSDGMISTPNKR